MFPIKHGYRNSEFSRFPIKNDKMVDLSIVFCVNVYQAG